MVIHANNTTISFPVIISLNILIFLIFQKSATNWELVGEIERTARLKVVFMAARIARRLQCETTTVLSCAAFVTVS